MECQYADVLGSEEIGAESDGEEAAAALDRTAFERTGVAPILELAIEV